LALDTCSGSIGSYGGATGIFPCLKIRFINVVDLFKLQPETEHPHGLSDRDFDSMFTLDKPIIFNFYGYPWLVHRLAYRRHNHHNLHVRGYKEKGNINTPLELAINNQIDRFSLAMDVTNTIEAAAYFPFAYIHMRVEEEIEIDLQTINLADEPDNLRYCYRQMVWKPFNCHINAVEEFKSLPKKDNLRKWRD
jgi:phosphoketolase